MIYWLIVLGIVVCIAASLIITTLRVTIPPMPSSPALRFLMISLLKKYHQEGPILELGSGWGGLSRIAARAYPHQEVTGIEISLIPFIFSWIVTKIFNVKNLKYKRNNIFRLTLEPGAAYLCYLSSGCMEKLPHRFKGEQGKGTVVISAVFALPGRTPLEIKEVNDLYRSKVYVYRLGDD